MGDGFLRISTKQENFQMSFASRFLRGCWFSAMNSGSKGREHWRILHRACTGNAERLAVLRCSSQL